MSVPGGRPAFLDLFLTNLGILNPPWAKMWFQYSKTNTIVNQGLADIFL